MKRPIVFLPPAAALLVSGLWLGLQHRSISHTETHNQSLAASIHQARSDGTAAAGDASESGPGAREGRPTRGSQPGGSTASGGATIRWDEIERFQQGPAPSDVAGMRMMIDLQAQLQEMDEAQLVDQFRQIEALDLPVQNRLELHALVMEALTRTNPALALEHSENWLSQQELGMISRQIQSTLSALARQDPAAAEAWLDRQIAAGRLESRALRGTNRTHVQLEAGLLRELLAKDPTAIARRAESMSPDLVTQVFDWIAMTLPAGQEKSFASQIRNALPEDQVTRVLVSASNSHFQRGSFQGVEDFINATEATETERHRIVHQVTNWSLQPNRGDLGENYEATLAWARRMLPEDSMDGITRNLLQQLAHRDVERAVSYAREHHAEGGSDDLLLPLIGNPEAVASGSAREMAESLRDPELRQQMLDALDGED